MSVTEKAFDLQFSYQIDHISTDFVVKRFENNLFIIITQYEKMCNLFKVRFDEQNHQLTNLGGSKIPLTISHHFGMDTDEYRGAIQFLVDNSKLKDCGTDILISLGLKNINGHNLRNISATLNSVLH